MPLVSSERSTRVDPKYRLKERLGVLVVRRSYNPLDWTVFNDGSAWHHGHPGRNTQDEITLFKAVGTALEDLAAASLAFDCHRVSTSQLTVA